mgnify:CR=1 FL=1
MNENSTDITKMPYAQWLEEALKNITALPMRTLVILGITEGGDMYNDYYNASIGDKLMIAGLVQQDAMYDSLEVNGHIKIEDDEEDSNGETEE